MRYSCMGLAPAPRMEFSHPSQHSRWRMGTLPFTRGVLVGLTHGGIGVNGAQNFIQTQAVFHSKHELCQQVAASSAHDGGAQDA